MPENIVSAHDYLTACGYTKTGIGKYTKVFGGTRIVIDRKKNTFIQYLASSTHVLTREIFEDCKFNNIADRIVYLEQRTVGVMW